MIFKLNEASRSNQGGNVLFLILIAVALFAALSYAVTQSTRSGGGSSDREQSILNSASMTQHPTSLRTALIRMILAGVDVSDLKFNAPADFAAITEEELVFHPRGGGAVFQDAPADLMSGATVGTWTFNANFDIPAIGSDGVDGNDVIAFLPGVSASVCRQIVSQFTLDLANCTTTSTGIPDLATSGVTVANIDELMDESYTFPTTDQEDLVGLGATCNAFDGQPSGCFNDTASGEFVFYSVLLER